MLKRATPIVLAICGCASDTDSIEHLNQPLPDGCREAPELVCGRGYSVFCLDTVELTLSCDPVWLRPGEVGYCCDDGTEI